MITTKNLTEQIGDDRQKLRLAALLHDIGHYPLSHVIETVMTIHGKRKECKHEALGDYIVTNSSLKNIISRHCNPKKIAQIIRGQSPKPLYNQLMSSDLDADRIDYLLRDSVHTGVAYGKFDLDRLIHTLTLDNQGLLCLEKSGRHAAEGYIIGRYLMWGTVYTHRVINAFNEVIERIYELGMNKEELFYSYDTMKKCASEDEKEFAKINDDYFFRNSYAKKKDDSHIDKLISVLLERRVLEVAAEARGLGKGGTGAKEYFLLDRYRDNEAITELHEKSGVPKEWIFHSNSRNALLDFKPLTDWPLDKEKEEEFDKESSKTIRIKGDDGKSVPLVQDKKSIVSYLQNISLDIVRIYTTEDYRKDLAGVLSSELTS